MPSSVISLSKLDVREEIPGMQAGIYEIPACDDSKPKILIIQDSFYFKPDLDGNQDMVIVPSYQIAGSIVQMHLSSQLSYKMGQHPAVFAVPHLALTYEDLRKTYAKEVENALAAQKAWFVALVRMADDDWQVAHRHNMISDTQRLAARELGLSRPWLEVFLTNEEQKDASCPFCGTGLLNADAPICPSCGRVHNPTKLAELEKRFGKEVVKA
jgi:hypothetical protein